jgi:transposase
VASVTLELDLPDGVSVLRYRRPGGAHGLEIAWPLPTRSTCDRCRLDEPVHLERTANPQVLRDLDILGQPSCWIYTAAFHRCSRCHRRQHLIPPFKRKDVSYTFRFERHVLGMLIGSNEEEGARRLGVSAEMVALIVRKQTAEAKPVDPDRVIPDGGIDALSLKKRHQLYVATLTDLSDPDRPEGLAVAKGKDEAAARACLGQLPEAQREPVRTHRVDRGAPCNAAGKELLPNSQAVVDRFHVAQKFHAAVDGLRKKAPGGTRPS